MRGQKLRQVLPQWPDCSYKNMREFSASAARSPHRLSDTAGLWGLVREANGPRTGLTPQWHRRRVGTFASMPWPEPRAHGSA